MLLVKFRCFFFVRDISIKKNSSYKRDSTFELLSHHNYWIHPLLILRFFPPKKSGGLFWVDICPFPGRKKIPRGTPNQLKGPLKALNAHLPADRAMAS